MEHPDHAKYATHSLAGIMIQKFVWHVKKRNPQRIKKMF